MLTRAFPPELIDEVAAECGRVEQRNRLLPARRLRSSPRVIKRKMSNWALKRAEYNNPPRPNTPTLQLVGPTKANPTRRKKPKSPVLGLGPGSLTRVRARTSFGGHRFAAEPLAGQLAGATVRRCDGATVRRCDGATVRRCDEARGRSRHAFGLSDAGRP
ncbi:transposase domain-containing protein [Actinacidiphila paucisporea]|uniref:transposase domain-containing protein n=1 Tax=Actinacidiphila paucisporea TaxID=310782 RepID=UPI0038990E0C